MGFSQKSPKLPSPKSQVSFPSILCLHSYTVTMFCGDETGAFVADLGYTNSRFGYGGDPDPKVRHILLFCNYLHWWRLPGDEMYVYMTLKSTHLQIYLYIHTYHSTSHHITRKTFKYTPFLLPLSSPLSSPLSLSSATSPLIRDPRR